MQRDTLIGGSVFGGIGGFELGFHWAGVQTAWSIEADPFRRALLRRNFPYTRVYSDVNYVDIPYDLRYVNVVYGGFPCQNTSHAGLQEGLDGPKSSLFFAFVNVIRELRPSYVVVENVSGLRSSGMGRVIGALAALGYVGEWESIPASVFGAPHQRDRVWIVGHLPLSARSAESGVSIQRAWSVADASALPYRGRSRTGILPSPPWSGNAGWNAIGCGSEVDADPVGIVDLPQSVTGNGSVIFCPHALGVYAEVCKSAWASEPGVDRVVDGIPARVDGIRSAPFENTRQARIAALGDSLVPQIAAFIALRIRIHNNFIVSE